MWPNSCRLPRREQEPLEQLLPQLLAALDAAKADPSEDVRRLVCQALVLLLDVAIEQLEPAMPQLVTFMLSASADADKLVALEASEFWSSLCETRCAVSALSPALPHLIPLLLRNMAYSEVEQAELLATGEEDESEADRPEDIKPRFHKSRPAHYSGGGGGGGEEDYDDDDDDDDDDDGAVVEWSLRKCSASGLDIIAGTLGGAILPHLLPELQARC